MLGYQLPLTLASLLLCAFLFIHSMIWRRRAKEHSNLIAKQKLTLQKYHEELTHKVRCIVLDQDFQTSLKKAEVTTNLQKSRISFHQDRDKLRIPERYAYVQSMFQSGMGTEEIAAALGMSSHEVSQLLALSTIASKTKSLDRTPKGISL